MTEQEAINILEKPSKHIRSVHEAKNGMQFHSYSTDLVKSFEMSIQALEKQITRKVIYARTSGGQSGYLCPVCENYLDHTIPKYCCICGQKIELGEWD